MAYPVLTAFLDRDGSTPPGIIFTAVLPGGCPLDCPFCLLKARDEGRRETYVTPQHLDAMMRGLHRRNLLGGAAVVGEEPLQSHCWPAAKLLLNRAIEHKVPAALITNGYNLTDFIDELRPLERTKITISLDAAGVEHDAIRRTPGAFDRISKGIKEAVRYPELRERLTIATILMPSNLELIGALITYAADLGVSQLFISPLLTYSPGAALTVHPKVMSEAWLVIPRLVEQARTAGVRLRFSDEFNILGLWEKRLAEAGIDIVVPKAPIHLIRIDAAGRVETLVTMREGGTTGLRVPVALTEADAFARQIADLCAVRSAVAA